MVDPGTAVEGQEATRPENQRSMEEQLEALNQKLQHLAEQERALSRRMACRSPSAARGKTVGLEDLGRAKRRNESLEEFCDHWMAWLRAGNLREGADAVAVCREQFLDSVEAMLPAWGELTSRETQIAVTEAKSQLQVLRDRRQEAVKHLKRSQELGQELRQIQAELQQQHLELPCLYRAAQEALSPEVLPPDSLCSADGKGVPGGATPVSFPWPPAWPGAWYWPPWGWQAPPPQCTSPIKGSAPRSTQEVRDGREEKPCVPCEPTEQERHPCVHQTSTVEQPNVPSNGDVSMSGNGEQEKKRGNGTEVPAAKMKEPKSKALVAEQEVEVQKPRTTVKTEDPMEPDSGPSGTQPVESPGSAVSRPISTVCQVSQPQQVLRQVKLLLTPVGKEPISPSALRKLLRSPEPWYQAVVKLTHSPQVLPGDATDLQLFAAALLLLKGHMSSNLAEASALSACEGAEALKLARSPEGHAMAWQELLAVLPELSQVSPKADFEALCKISAEQLLPRSRADPVRRLGQALVQIAMPSRDPPQEPPSPKSEDMSVKNDSIPLGNRDDAGKLRRWSEKSSGAYQVRPKVSMARSKEQIDLSKMIRKDPAWKVAQKTEEDASESEIADVEDL